jgi:hypothetical protein
VEGGTSNSNSGRTATQSLSISILFLFSSFVSRVGVDCTSRLRRSRVGFDDSRAGRGRTQGTQEGCEGRGTKDEGRGRDERRAGRRVASMRCQRNQPTKSKSKSDPRPTTRDGTGLLHNVGSASVACCDV